MESVDVNRLPHLKARFVMTIRKCLVRKLWIVVPRKIVRDNYEARWEIKRGKFTLEELN